MKKHSSKNLIMMSYDDSPYIRELYNEYYIFNFDFVYSMTNTGGNSCREGQEIVITNYVPKTLRKHNPRQLSLFSEDEFID